MQVININGKKIAVGLEWEIIDSPTQDKLREVAKKEKSYNYGVAFTFENTTSAGFSDKKPKAPIGSIMLALAQQEYLNGINRDNENIKQDWIVVEKDETEGYWLAVLQDGVPSPLFDKYTHNFGVIQEELARLLKVDTYILYTKLPEVREFLENEGIATTIEAQGFEELVFAVDPKTVKKHSNFKKLTGVRQEYLIIGGVLVALTIGLLTYDIVGGMIQQSNAKKARDRQIQAEKARIEAEYKARIGEYYTAFYEARKKALSETSNYIAQDTKATFNIWSDYSNFNLPTSGWEVSKIRCEVTGNEQLSDKILCVKSFKKGTHTTNAMLIEAEPTAFMASPTAADATAEKRFAYPVTGASLANYNFITLDDFAINFISHVQLLKYSGIDLELRNSPQEIVFTPPALPLTKEQIDQGVKPAPTVPLKVGYAKGLFTLSGKTYSKYAELADNIPWNSISLASSEINFTSYSEPTWKTDFNYILKTKADNLEPPNIGQYTPSSFPEILQKYQ